MQFFKTSSSLSIPSNNLFLLAGSDGYILLKSINSTIVNIPCLVDNSTSSSAYKFKYIISSSNNIIYNICHKHNLSDVFLSKAFFITMSLSHHCASTGKIRPWSTSNLRWLQYQLMLSFLLHCFLSL